MERAPLTEGLGGGTGAGPLQPPGAAWEQIFVVVSEPGFAGHMNQRNEVLATIRSRDLPVGCIEGRCEAQAHPRLNPT
ncbi:hypothetical protein GCM10010298_56670 [Streptomyces microflavus]|nr:hypothetical protein GCM10010298_56670 [Streptomyces microflavus]